MKFSAEELHHKVLTALVNQNCVSAAEDYFQMIAPLCPVRDDIAHSLLRIAIRPVFYMGIADVDSALDVIKGINKERHSFIHWLSQNTDILALVIKELTICCLFYTPFEYDIVKDVVVFNHQIDESMVDVFVEVPDRDIYEEFSTFDEFRIYFFSLFCEYNISQEELARLLQEENCEQNFNDCKSRPVKTTYSQCRKYRYEITKRKGGAYQVFMQKLIPADDYSSQYWTDMPHYVHITDSVERAEEVGDEELRNLSWQL